MVPALKRISPHTNSTSKWPAVTLLTQQPFIYTKGLEAKKQMRQECIEKPSNIADHLYDTPMMRIGGSFTRGDGLSKFL